MSNIYFDTLGCFKNNEDTERAAGILTRAGHKVTEDPENADIIIVNTCGFIEAAKRESIEHIFDALEYAAEDKNKKIIITGCLAQRYGEELKEEIPEAAAIIGVNDYEKLPELLSSLRAKRSNPETNEDSVLQLTGKESILTGRRYALAPRYSSFLKIAEGCSNRCTYCAIPMIRGNYRSVPHETVIEDAIMLASEGAKEINIIAQDTSAYGMDFNNKTSLPLLLKDIAAVQGPEWLRLLYCYEERITDELIEVMAAEPKIVKYIDIPLQHCSDRILRAMKRRSTHGSIEDTIKKLRSAMPDIAIRTTLMTGFPGETEADFRELEEFVEEMKFDRLGVFAFSPEEGTPAAEFEDQIPQEIAEERRDHIMQLQQEISLEGNRRLVGSTMKVLVCETEEPEDKVYVGRTYKDAPEIDNSVIFRAKTPLTPGDFAEVLITDAMDYDLVGETTT